MTVVAPSDAPSWGQNFAKAISAALDRNIWPWVSRRNYTVSQLTGTNGATLAAKYPWQLVIVSNGASNKFVAISNSSAWFYADGTSV